MQVPMMSKRGHQTPGAGVVGNCERPGWVLELNSEAWQVLLTAKPSISPGKPNAYDRRHTLGLRSAIVPLEASLS